jgi:hypothetical protein
MNTNFSGELWRWGGGSSWYFVTLPKDLSDVLASAKNSVPRGFGSVRVAAKVGGSEWHTSVFPDSRSGCYIMPVKKQIRRAEMLEECDRIDVSMRIDL